MHCHEAFRCPRDDCPVKQRRLRRCWEYFKSQGIAVTPEVCPYSPCERCHYHMGWEIGLIGESLFTDPELPEPVLAPPVQTPPNSLPLPIPAPIPASPEVVSPVPAVSPPLATDTSVLPSESRLPPFPPEEPPALPVAPIVRPPFPEADPAPVSTPPPPVSPSPELSPARNIELSVSPKPEGGKRSRDDGQSRESPDEVLPTIDEILPRLLPGEEDEKPLPEVAPKEKPPLERVPEALPEAIGTLGNRFCWEIMKCDNLQCPVRQRQIIRCFGFFGPRSQEEKDRLCGCQRLCENCHYHRGWELGVIHEGLFEDLLEERRRRMVRAHSLQQKGIVEIYLQELARKPLTRSEEVTLAKRLAGDKQAAELLLTANLKLVVRISSQFANRGLNLMDLIQEGNLGLIKAISKFDWRLGYKFSTYAAYWVRHYMQRAVSNQGRVVRVPHHLLMVAHKIRRAISEFQGQWQRSPNLTELSGLMGLEEEKVLDIIRITETPISIEARQNDGEEDESPLEYFLADKNRLTPEEEMLEKAKAEACAEALKSLPDRLREVVECFYGFRDEEVSLAELGRRMGISRERVRQLLQEALKKLGEREFVAHLKDFL